MLMTLTSNIFAAPDIRTLLKEEWINSTTYTISGSATYDKYKNKIGQTTIGTLETRTYDDGTIKYGIVSLE